MAAPAPSSSRGERTRAAILVAAEDLFAERGFDATRLEDVAGAVGIRRASIVYYFRDKTELYDAVLADVVMGLYARIEPTLTTDAPISERVPRAVAAWVDAIGDRPSLARLLLREVADTARDERPRLTRHIAPFFELAQRLAAERGAERGKQTRTEPVQIASTLAGATVFFVAAIPRLLGAGDFDPLAPERLVAHRREMLRLTRFLLHLPDETAPHDPDDET